MLSERTKKLTDAEYSPPYPSTEAEIRQQIDGSIEEVYQIYKPYFDVPASNVSAMAIQAYNGTNPVFVAYMGNSVAVENFPLIIPEADDTARIQRAIDYASVNSKKYVVLASKTYNISDTLKVPAYMSFGGIGGVRGTGTIINMTVSNKNMIELLADASHQISKTTIHNMCLYANTGLTGVNGIYANLPSADYIMSNCLFEELDIRRCENGILIDCVGYCGIMGLVFKGVECQYGGTGIYVKATNSGGIPWFNMIRYQNCKFNKNTFGGVIYDDCTTTENHFFDTCYFESIGLEGLESGVAAECYAFKNRTYLSGPTVFKNCYFEGNIPRRTATQAEIDDFTANGETTTYGKSLNGEELVGTFIYPLTIDRTKVANIITRGNVHVEECILADCSNDITVIGVGSITLTNNEIYKMQQNYSHQPASMITISGAAQVASINQSRLIRIQANNNQYQWSSTKLQYTYLTKMYEVIDGYAYGIRAFGQLNPKNPQEHYTITENGNQGYNKIYVDGTSGNDTNNLGVFSDSPFKSLSKALEFANLSTERNIDIYLSGTVYTTTTTQTVRNKNLTIQALDAGAVPTIQNKMQYSTTIATTTLIGCNVEFINLNFTLIGDGINGSVFAVQGNSNMYFSNCTFDSDHTYSALLDTSTKGARLKVVMSGCTASNTGLFVRKRAGSVVEAQRGINWTFHTNYGTTAQRPPSTYLSIGDAYFDTQINKNIWWNGTAWVDSAGTAV